MTTPPYMKLLPHTDTSGRALFELTRSYTYQLGPGDGNVVKIPRGYVTNFGTIPWFFAWLISPSQLREAALVHDYMCNEDFKDDGRVVSSGWSRFMADATLYDGMARLGFFWPRRVAVFAAVRTWAVLSGQSSWMPPPDPIPNFSEEDDENDIGSDCYL